MTDTGTEPGSAQDADAALDAEAGRDAGAVKRSRATPMSPEQRRDAIIAATVPLVRQFGFDVSTRQIAEAAGIAEGTIFRVFDTKEELLREAVQAALDPVVAEARLRAVDMDAPLRERVHVAAELLQRRMKDVIELAVAVGRVNFSIDDTPHRQARYERLGQMLADLFEPDRHRLRCEPADAARYLQIIAFGGSHPRLSTGRMMTTDEMVDLLLDGVCAHDDPPRGDARADDTQDDPSP